MSGIVVGNGHDPILFHPAVPTVIAFAPSRDAAYSLTPETRRGALQLGSHSYLGLEHHSALKAAVRTATERYGTQFASPRTAVSCGLYVRLEELLHALYGRPVVASSSPAMAHLVALPALVSRGDLVVLDAQVPASVRLTAQLLAGQGVELQVVRHSDLQALEGHLRASRQTGRKAWYVGCGVYAQHGDPAPLRGLRELLGRYEGLHLYLNDGHGMSWTGPRGVGYVESRIGAHPRVVMTVALDKAFAASGAVLVLPDDRFEQRIRDRGAALLCSGPLQPPMMGAAVASAELHLSGEVEQHQRKLQDLVEHCARGLAEAGLPQTRSNDGPLFFVPAGQRGTGPTLAERLEADGFATARTGPVGATPPLGIRFAVNASLQPSDLDRFIDALAYHHRCAGRAG